MTTEILEFSVGNLDSLVSTNDMYVPTLNRKTHHCFLRKSEGLIRFQSIMDKLFESGEIGYDKDKLDKYLELNPNPDNRYLFILTIWIPASSYYSSKSQTDLNNNDSSNYVKSIEDSIMSHLGIDDKYNLIIVSRKKVSEDSHWKFHVSLVPYTNDNYVSLDMVLDNISNYRKDNTREDV